MPTIPQPWQVDCTTMADSNNYSCGLIVLSRSTEDPIFLFTTRFPEVAHSACYEELNANRDVNILAVPI